MFEPHLRHIHIHPVSVAFCFTPISVKATFILSVVACVNHISDTSVFVLSLSSLGSHPHPHHHSAFVCRLLFHPHLRQSNIHSLILSSSSSVSHSSPPHPNWSSLRLLSFHSQLRHIHIDSISYIFCFTPISATSTFVLSPSSSVSPPTTTYPH